MTDNKLSNSTITKIHAIENKQLKSLLLSFDQKIVDRWLDIMDLVVLHSSFDTYRNNLMQDIIRMNIRLYPEIWILEHAQTEEIFNNLMLWYDKHHTRFSMSNDIRMITLLSERNTFLDNYTTKYDLQFF